MVAAGRAALVKAAVQAQMMKLASAPVQLEDKTEWKPEPYQLAPEGVPGVDWGLWMLLGGRGTGKTDCMSYYVNKHVLGPPCDTRIPGGHRIGIVSPTLGDAADACVKGPTGLKAHNPAIQIRGGMGGIHVYWPNGAEGKLFSTENARTVDRLRAGGNRCLDFWDEFAAWPMLKEGYDQAMLGLRLGPHAHAVASTTPRPRAKLVEVLKDERTRSTHASTDDNPHLSSARRAEYRRLYAGTRLGRQELGGEILVDAEGALWSRDTLEVTRVRKVNGLYRVVVGVDPSGGSTEGHDEQGIVVAGIGPCPAGMGHVVLDDGTTLDVSKLPHGFVLDDASCLLDPDGWGRQVVRAYLDWLADLIVIEKNFGGEMAKATVMNAARAMGVTVNVKVVTASRGKAVRAEPVAALQKQQRIHHVNGADGRLLLLEDELCTWVPGSGKSPNRLDADVWCFTELLVDGTVGVWGM